MAHLFKSKLFYILFFASVLRLTNLETHMPALYGDEIAIGYNAWSILKTGRDEFGRFMPLQFESWGDQKNPVYIYLVSLAQVFFGPSAVSVRLPSAVAGILAVYLTYKLVFLLLQQHRATSKLAVDVGAVAALLLSISPWHLHISRGGYEANLALTLGLASAYLLLDWFYHQTKRGLTWSVLTLVLALYTYYTTKMFAPMLITGVWIWGTVFVTQKLRIKESILYYVGIFVLALPVIYLALFANGQARFSAINIFSDKTTVNRVIRDRNFFSDPGSFLAKVAENKYTYYALDFLTYYFDNFSGQFLFVGGDSNVRYGLANHGMLYLIEAPLILLGIILFFHKNRKAWYLLMGWMILSPVPTALVGRAYGLRSIAMLPIPQIFAAFSIVYIFTNIKQAKLRFAFCVTASAVYLLSFANWGLRYIYQYPTYGRYWYDSAIKEEIEYARERDNDYDMFILTGAYGKTSIYYAYYLGIDPREYWEAEKNKVVIDGIPMVHFGKYYFGDLRPKGSIEGMHLPDNTLVIAEPTSWYSEQTISARDDGRVIFHVYSIPTLGQLAERAK